MESDPGDVVTARYMPLLTFNNFTQITKYFKAWVSNFYMAEDHTLFCGLARGPHMKK